MAQIKQDDEQIAEWLPCKTHALRVAGHIHPKYYQHILSIPNKHLRKKSYDNKIKNKPPFPKVTNCINWM